MSVTKEEAVLILDQHRIDLQRKLCVGNVCDTCAMSVKDGCALEAVVDAIVTAAQKVAER